MDENKKDAVYFSVLKNVLKLEVQKGHLKWTISELSRKSNVTRSLIYYYFGRNKQKLITEAAQFLGEKLFSLAPSTTPIAKRLTTLLAFFKEDPYVFTLFYLNRGQDNDIGKIIREVEKKFFNKLHQEYPLSSKNQIKLLYLIELGALTYQNVDETFINWAATFLISSMKHERESIASTKNSVSELRP